MRKLNIDVHVRTYICCTPLTRVWGFVCSRLCGTFRFIKLNCISERGAWYQARVHIYMRWHHTQGKMPLLNSRSTALDYRRVSRSINRRCTKHFCCCMCASCAQFRNYHLTFFSPSMKINVSCFPWAHSTNIYLCTIGKRILQIFNIMACIWVILHYWKCLTVTSASVDI